MQPPPWGVSRAIQVRRTRIWHPCVSYFAQNDPEPPPHTPRAHAGRQPRALLCGGVAMGNGASPSPGVVGAARGCPGVVWETPHAFRRVHWAGGATEPLPHTPDRMLTASRARCRVGQWRLKWHPDGPTVLPMPPKGDEGCVWAIGECYTPPIPPGKSPGAPHRAVCALGM